MAEIFDDLRLNIEKALRDADEFGRALDRAVGDVEIRIDPQQLQAAQTAARNLGNELEATEDSARILNTETDEFEQKLRGAERAAERLNTEMTSVALSAGRAEVDVRDLARALDISEDEARRLAAEVLDAQAAANRLNDAAKATAQSLGLSEDEARRFANSLEKAARESDDINTGGKQLVSTFGNLRTIALGVTAAISAIGIGRGISLAARGAQAAVTEFARLNESANAVKVIFDEGAEAIFAFGETATRSVLLSRQAFQEAVVPIGAVLRNFGFDARDAASASIELIERAADLASVMNTDVSQALLAINAALVGQVEPLRRFGGEISQARVEAFAFATGLAQSGEVLDQATLVQARLGLILQDTAFAAGDVANTIDEYANANRAAKASVEEFSADIGEQLLPAFEGILNLVPDILDGLRFLIPAFGEAAGAARDFFDSIDPGEDEGRGDPFGGFFAGLRGGAEVVGEAFAGFADLGTFIGSTLLLDFEAAGRASERFGRRIDTVAIAIGRVAAADVVTETGDRLRGFAEGLSFVGRETESIETFTRAFSDFGIALNLTVPELREIIPQIIEQAQNLGLSSLEIDFLTDALQRLDVSLVETEPRLLQLAGGVEAVEAALTRAPPAFTNFVNQVGEFDEGIQTFAERISTAIETVTNSLDPFAGAATKTETSATEFFNTLVSQVETKAETAAGLIKLIDLGFEDLALSIGAEAAKGTDVTNLIDEFLANQGLSQKAEDILDGLATETVSKFNAEAVEALGSEALAIDQADALVSLIEAGLIDQPTVLDALSRAAIANANAFAADFGEAMVTTEPALASASADSIERALVNGALGMNVQELANALNIPLQQAALAIRLQISPDQIIIPNIAAPVIVSGGGKQFASGGITQNFNVFNAPAIDPASSIEQGAQIAGAIGGSLIGFTPE